MPATVNVHCVKALSLYIRSYVHADIKATISVLPSSTAKGDKRDIGGAIPWVHLAKSYLIDRPEYSAEAR